MPRPIRVVIVDDSALMREMLKDILSRETGMEVAGVARDAFEAREVIKATNPDVITLDVEMPKMDGLSFLEKIMTLRPTPVIMVSSLTREGSDAAIRALELGAVDCVAKPGGSDGHGFEATAMELAPYNITVNTVLPGYTQTQALGESLTEKSGFKKKTPQELLKEIEESIPMGRLAKPSEIANVAVFLASERAGYMTGQSIAVDGGFTKGI